MSDQAIVGEARAILDQILSMGFHATHRSATQMIDTLVGRNALGKSLLREPYSSVPTALLSHFLPAETKLSLDQLRALGDASATTLCHTLGAAIEYTPTHRGCLFTDLLFILEHSYLSAEAASRITDVLSTKVRLGTLRTREAPDINCHMAALRVLAAHVMEATSLYAHWLDIVHDDLLAKDTVGPAFAILLRVSPRDAIRSAPTWLRRLEAMGEQTAPLLLSVLVTLVDTTVVVRTGLIQEVCTYLSPTECNALALIARDYGAADVAAALQNPVQAGTEIPDVDAGPSEIVLRLVQEMRAPTDDELAYATRKLSESEGELYLMMLSAFIKDRIRLNETHISQYCIAIDMFLKASISATHYTLRRNRYLREDDLLWRTIIATIGLIASQPVYNTVIVDFLLRLFPHSKGRFKLVLEGARRSEEFRNLFIQLSLDHVQGNSGAWLQQYGEPLMSTIRREAGTMRRSEREVLTEWLHKVILPMTLQIDASDGRSVAELADGGVHTQLVSDTALELAVSCADLHPSVAQLVRAAA
jgi:hypothetical protein